MLQQDPQRLFNIALGLCPVTCWQSLEKNNSIHALEFAFERISFNRSLKKDNNGLQAKSKSSNTYKNTQQKEKISNKLNTRECTTAPSWRHMDQTIISAVFTLTRFSAGCHFSNIADPEANLDFVIFWSVLYTLLLLKGFIVTCTFD